MIWNTFSSRVVSRPATATISSDAWVSDAYANIMRVPAAGQQPGGALDAMKLDAAHMTKADLIHQMVQAADATTSVATLSYQFFTGAVPSQAGIDYLVSPDSANPNNLNSAYYQSFNLENRYINFAVNLGKAGAGHDAFEAAYGSKSLAETVKGAYAEIFGAALSDAKAAELVDPRADYFASYGLDGPNGIGTKAAAVGWLLAEAAKSDVGAYAEANDAFLTDLADGASFGVSLIGAYGGEAPLLS